jgi:hypothetical protein
MRVPIANTNSYRDIIQEIFNNEAIITITANYAKFDNCQYVDMSVMSSLPVDEHNKNIQLAMRSAKSASVERESKPRYEIDVTEKEQIDINISDCFDNMHLMPSKLFEEEDEQPLNKFISTKVRRSPTRGLMKSMLNINRKAKMPDKPDKPISVFNLGIAYPVSIPLPRNVLNSSQPQSPFSLSLQNMLKENGDVTKSVETNSGYSTAMESPITSDTETKSNDGKQSGTKPRVLFKPKWLSVTSVEESVLDILCKELIDTFGTNKINIDTKENEQSNTNRKRYFYVNIRSNMPSPKEHDLCVVNAMQRVGLKTDKYTKTAVYHADEKEKERREREMKKK